MSRQIQAIIFSNKHDRNNVTFNIMGKHYHRISIVRLLGNDIDSRLWFSKYVYFISTKAGRKLTLLEIGTVFNWKDKKLDLFPSYQNSTIAPWSDINVPWRVRWKLRECRIWDICIAHDYISHYSDLFKRSYLCLLIGKDYHLCVWVEN